MNTELRESIVTLRDGSQVTVRPICKSDRELERRFIEGLSPASRHYRFLCAFSSPSEDLLTRLTDIDESVDCALIALTRDDPPREVGVARFSRQSDGSAEVAVTVADDWQHRGLATNLMRQLIDIARERGVTELYSVDPAENSAMHELADYLGFKRTRDPQDGTQVVHTLTL